MTEHGEPQMKKILSAASLCLLCMSGASAADSPNPPSIDWLEKPLSEGSRMKIETIVVDGKPWDTWFTSIPRYGFFSDGRVWIVGRNGLQFFVVIDNKPWKNSVYNSSFLVANEGATKVMQIDSKGTVIVNDELQPMQMGGELLDAGFGEHDAIMVVWRLSNGDVVLTKDGSIIQRVPAEK